MPGSGFREWWRAQLDAPRNNAFPGPSICPCASCFNGTGHASAVSYLHYFSKSQAGTSILTDLAGWEAISHTPNYLKEIPTVGKSGERGIRFSTSPHSYYLDKPFES
ncbi:hypothetical protein F4823DRAFT_584506 [Ustulina deusta]|nr:hypothetical protein F4823DRAFT_584506 [Ustulina deusta]